MAKLKFHTMNVLTDDPFSGDPQTMVMALGYRARMYSPTACRLTQKPGNWVGLTVIWSGTRIAAVPITGSAVDISRGQTSILTGGGSMPHENRHLGNL